MKIPIIYNVRSLRQRPVSTLTTALGDIARETGLEVLDLRLEADHHIDLGFPLS